MLYSHNRKYFLKIVFSYASYVSFHLSGRGNVTFWYPLAESFAFFLFWEECSLISQLYLISKHCQPAPFRP
jgi:hypothetical protein